MRSAAGLHGADLYRQPEVADVEDPDAAEALFARHVDHALQAAVETSARLLDGQDQQIADDRHVALATRAHDRAQEFRGAGIADVVGIEPVVVARNDDIARENEVRIGEIEQAWARAVVVLVGFVAVVSLRCFLSVAVGLCGGVFGCTIGEREFGFGFSILGCGFPVRAAVVRPGGCIGFAGRRLRGLGGLLASTHRPAGRVLGIEEAHRLRQRHDEFHVQRNLFRIIEARREADSGVGRESRQHRVHAVDLGALVGIDVRGELVEDRILSGSRLLEEVVDHLERTFVMLDHEFEKQRIEGRAVLGGKFLHLLRRRHPGHEFGIVMAMRAGARGPRDPVRATSPPSSRSRLPAIARCAVRACGWHRAACARPRVPSCPSAWA